MEQTTVTANGEGSLVVKATATIPGGNIITQIATINVTSTRIDVGNSDAERGRGNTGGSSAGSGGGGGGDGSSEAETDIRQAYR